MLNDHRRVFDRKPSLARCEANFIVVDKVLREGLESAPILPSVRRVRAIVDPKQGRSTPSAIPNAAFGRK